MVKASQFHDFLPLKFSIYFNCDPQLFIILKKSSGNLRIEQSTLEGFELSPGINITECFRLPVINLFLFSVLIITAYRFLSFPHSSVNLHFATMFEKLDGNWNMTEIINPISLISCQPRTIQPRCWQLSTHFSSHWALIVLKKEYEPQRRRT